MYDSDEFIGRLVQYISIQYIRPIRYFDIYSSKSKGIGREISCVIFYTMHMAMCIFTADAIILKVFSINYEQAGD